MGGEGGIDPFFRPPCIGIHDIAYVRDAVATGHVVPEIDIVGLLSVGGVRVV